MPEEPTDSNQGVPSRITDKLSLNETTPQVKAGVSPPDHCARVAPTAGVIA